GTPAQAVQHAILEIMPSPPDLVVAGINYGTNFGTGVTISGTVGAAMEGASHGIPALAISLETEHKYHLTYSKEVDFKPSAHFTTYFARQLLNKKFPEDVQVLKVEVPQGATIETPWVTTRLSRLRFYLPTAPKRTSWSEPGSTGYSQVTDSSTFAPGTDVHAVIVERKVAVTPISLDQTSRVDLADLDHELRQP
ncbi:MAG TPA: 5'/3'-nucleotidase SurE, partial [Terriglobales bacterium]|nr:5'/3'-nucleotidase SurE [Terriglobales bacterium]